MMEKKRQGIVVKSTGSWYRVRLGDGQLLDCRMKGRFRMEGRRTTNPLAVGDVVTVEENEEGGMVTAIAKRKNYLIRKSTNLSKESHVMAANVDQLLLIVTVNHPETSTVFIDRFLASAEAYAIPAVLVFNKVDLYDAKDRETGNARMAVYRRIGYPCLEVSAVTGERLDELKALLCRRITVVAGLSGVGKSSLINAIEPGLQLKTALISAVHDAGRHTTTFAEMFPLHGGGYIVDTPGVRSFGLVDMAKEEISHYFPEIFARSADCRFCNCTHTHEPGCAVCAAVQEGGISESRYASYLGMLEESRKYR